MILHDLRSEQKIAVSEALEWGRSALSSSPTPSLDAQVILAHTLGRRRSWVLAHGGDCLDADEHRAYVELIQRRANGEPVAYIRGHVEWFGLELEVTPEVLIPRAETELVAERAIELAREKQAHLVADIGTGSGAIAIARATSLPTVRIYAVDSSPAALRVAASNVARHNVAGQVSLVNGSLLTPLRKEPDLIVANLPYVATEHLASLDRSVRYEPLDALSGGADGLELYAKMFDQMAQKGWAPDVVCEIDPRQPSDMRALVNGAFPGARIGLLTDYAGRDRIVEVRQPASGARDE